jgi:transcriptional regulator with XRE-family HTH domain
MMKSPAIELLDGIEQHLGKGYRAIVAEAAGVDRSTVGRWHNGERTPNMAEGQVLYSMYAQLTGKPIGFPTYLENSKVVQSNKPSKAQQELESLMEDIKNLKPVHKSQVKRMVELLKADS